MSSLVRGRYFAHFIALLALGLLDRGDRLIINCLLRVAFQILAQIAQSSVLIPPTHWAMAELPAFLRRAGQIPPMPGTRPLRPSQLPGLLCPMNHPPHHGLPEAAGLRGPQRSHRGTGSGPPPLCTLGPGPTGRGPPSPWCSLQAWPQTLLWLPHKLVFSTFSF